MMVGLQELYISLIVVSSTWVVILSEGVLLVDDLEIVVADMFYPVVYWNISSGIPSVQVIHVQWLFMSGVLDRLSKQVDKELILLFPF